MDIKNNIIIPNNTANSIVFMLHGYGSDGADMFGIAKFLKNSFPNTIFICPNAPQPCEMGMGFQWFSLRNTSQHDILVSKSMLDGFIRKKIVEFKIPYNKVIIMGFSQGGMMALSSTLSSNEPFAGVIGCSTRLVHPDSKPINTSTPVLLTHGSLDTVIESASMDRATAFLNKYSIPVNSLLFPTMAHSINDGCIQAMENFIRINLSK